MKNFLAILLPILVVYLIGAIGTGYFDLSRWSEGARSTAVFFLVIYYLFNF